MKGLIIPISEAPQGLASWAKPARKATNTI